ncbi:ER membrane protein complex subunit 10 [Tribolium castaneum]|uniref:ER membrane protein complex subunit 10 n=1 Tax=Tribolium castaneum TaxID=7070 RepID=D6WD56_TRICA|nr:PREDICTED: ER membrane protein complex subunit 10 [Tribolium castaneum]EEZ98312.1 ER membrane protein complex subunit 10-like Protein [Tribolium castaneum]|eukprot:XP_972261.1 PREDICTED: ER membrane protein complex subunit 10 [Tribolium castaneum]
MLKILTLPCFLFIIRSSLASNLEHDGWANIKLEHCLVPSASPVFTERGNITIQSLRLGQAIVKQNPLTEQEKNQLRDLAAKNQFYQIRSTVVASDGAENTFLSTIKACMLAESELDDKLSVSLDYTGRVIGVTLLIASSSTCEGAFVPLSKLKQFTTHVYVRHSDVGPIPNTQSYIEKLEREKEARERGEVKDNRSILAKYWMYIVPVVILLMVSSMANPEAAAGNGGGAGR